MEKAVLKAGSKTGHLAAPVQGPSSLHIPSPACESRTCGELVRCSPTSALNCKVHAPLSSNPRPDPRAVHLCTWGRGHIKICLTHITVTGCILWNSGLGKSRCGPASECFLSQDCRQHPCACAEERYFPLAHIPESLAELAKRKMKEKGQPRNLNAQEGPLVPWCP